MSEAKLVHKLTKVPVFIGEEVTSFRGETAFVTQWALPSRPGSTGRVYVRNRDGLSRVGKPPMPYKDGNPTLGEQIDADMARSFYTKDILREARHDRDEIKRLRTAMQEACDLLAERTHGSPARSAGHNARLRLEAALKE